MRKADNQATSTPSSSDNDDADKFTMTMIRDWRVARARQSIEWAEASFQERNGKESTTPLNFENLERMQQCEHHLAQAKPLSGGAARELLWCATEILAHQTQDPEHVFSGGPVLDIVRNVRDALDFLSDRYPLCPREPDDNVIALASERSPK